MYVELRPIRSSRRHQARRPVHSGLVYTPTRSTHARDTAQRPPPVSSRNNNERRQHNYDTAATFSWWSTTVSKVTVAHDALRCFCSRSSHVTSPPPPRVGLPNHVHPVAFGKKQTGHGSQILHQKTGMRVDNSCRYRPRAHHELASWDAVDMRLRDHLLFSSRDKNPRITCSAH